MMKKHQKIDEKISKFLTSKSDREIRKEIIKRIRSKEYDNIDIVFDTVRFNYLEGLKTLDEHDVNLRFYNDAALEYAAEKGSLSIVKYLVEKKRANIHTDFDEPLGRAAEEGHLNVVKYLVEKGADISAGDYYAVKIADMNNHLGVSEYLHDKLNF